MPAPGRTGPRRHVTRTLSALALAAFATGATGGPALASSPNTSLVLGPRFHASEHGRAPVAEAAWNGGSGIGSSSRWLSVSGLAGSTQPDRGLADYQWDTTPHLAWGMKAMAGAGRFGAGIRLWRTRTTQDLGLAGETDPAVTSTSLELVGSARLASAWGTDVSATAGAGWLRLAYQPDEMTLDTGGGGTVVSFAPIDEWIGGVGLALRRPALGPWALGLEVDHRRFALDTAHRSGPAIVTERPTFSEWSARLELAWTRGW